jgi:hypothetical protein
MLPAASVWQHERVRLPNFTMGRFHAEFLQLSGPFCVCQSEVCCTDAAHPFSSHVQRMVYKADKHLTYIILTFCLYCRTVTYTPR